jgi:superfamily II helicase
MTDFEELILPYFLDTTFEQGLEELATAYVGNEIEERRALSSLRQMIAVARAGDLRVMDIAREMSVSFANTPVEFAAELERMLAGYEDRISMRNNS